MKFSVHLPPYSVAVLAAVGVVSPRTFANHDTFAVYLQAWADAGYNVTWSDAYNAHIQPKVSA